jgi:transcription-repair coupling factor (superfamily II helicase)
MDLYRRIASIPFGGRRRRDDRRAHRRFGDPPSETVSALVSIALLRGRPTRSGITDISQKAGALRLKVSDFDMNRISALYNKPEYKGRVKVEAGVTPCISLKLRTSNIVDEAVRFVRAYGQVV